MVTFHSVDSDGNKVIFSENYSRKDNIIIFNDKTCPNTQIEITINDDETYTLTLPSSSINIQLTEENFIQRIKELN